MRPSRSAVETAWVSAGTYALYGAMFGVSILINRTYGTGELGRFGIAWAVAQLTVQSAVSGFSAIHRRNVASGAGEVGELVADTLAVRLLSVSGLLGVAAFALAVLPIALGLRASIFAVMLAKGVEAVGTTFAETLQARGQNRTFAALSALNAAALLAAVTAAWAAGRGAGLIYPATIGAATVYLCVCTVAYARRLGRPRVRFVAERMRAVLAESWPLAVNAVVVVMAGRVAVLAVGAFAGETAAGVYTFASGVVGGMGVVAAAIGVVLFPELCATFARDPGALRPRMFGLVRRLAVVGVGAAVLLAVVCQPVVDLYGDLPPSAPAVLLALAVGLVATFASVAPSYMFTAIGQQREGMAYSFVNVAVLAVLVLPLTAAYGAVGAAAGVSAAQAVMAAVAVIWLDRRHLRAFTLRPAPPTEHAATDP